MKILISSTGKTKEDLLNTRFGRCEYFQIHNTESGEFKVIENKGQDASAGAGILASNQIIDEKTDIVITGNLGPNSFGLIEKCGIIAYKCESISINTVLEKYKKGELEEIKMSGPAYHGGGK